MMNENGQFILRPIGRILEEEEPGDDEDLARFWLQKQVFTAERHAFILEPSKTVAQTWRMKERMKTVSVALVLCLNIGVDPPDTIKISPCARQQCWIDPLQFGDANGGNIQKPIEVIGATLQKQYERWQPKARYKLSLDPTVDDIKKLCMSLRRNAKDERVLFHYNGHGVPRPTPNGEVWVFNKHYTQYIPLSVCDLQMWMGSPSIYVFDCSNAGNVVEYLKNPVMLGAYKESDLINDDVNNSAPKDPPFPLPVPPLVLTPPSPCILLAACQANETLPLCPDLPADLFTSCLTTPIKVALKWYVLSKSSKLVPGFTVEMADQIPGLLNDRRTMLGELNWIFTAVTDTIAWNVLSRELFQKLFRQDLLVASLFRNFLLAEKILNFYNCSPISLPQLPPTRHHFMWLAWDYALDGVLQQLPQVLLNPTSFQHSPFFSDQLTGFEVWLDGAVNMNEDEQCSLSPPEQLPIVLQVLLSQVHRQRALELLGRFLDLGQWAVNLALSVGIFPYVLKLLQSSARELKMLLVFIWAKLLAVDSSCQSDLVKDNGHKYFIDVLADLTMPAESRLISSFVLALIVNDYPYGQEVTVKNNIICVCLDQLQDSNHMLRMWLLLCLGKVWNNYDDARWRAVRDSAHEKVFPLLTDPVPEVRAAAVYSLGTFMANQTERVDQVIKLDQLIASNLLNSLYDASPLVRKELVISLSGYVSNFTMQMEKIALESLIQKSNQSYHTVTAGQNNITFNKSLGRQMVRSTSASDLMESLTPGNISLTQVGSLTPTPMRSSNAATKVWNALMILKNDPQPHVSKMTNELCDDVKKRANDKYVKIQNRKPNADPSNPKNLKKKTVADPSTPPITFLSTFFQWCCRQFAEADTTLKISQHDHNMGSGAGGACLASQQWYEKDFLFNRAARVLASGRNESLRNKSQKCDDLLFSNKFSRQVGILRFHPFDNQLAVVEEVNVHVYDWDTNTRLATVHNNKPHTRITHVDFINAHDSALLLTGTNESVVKVFKNYHKDGVGELVSCWLALNDCIPMSNSPGMVMEWDERTQLLYAGGNVNYIRIWDVNSEMKKMDFSLMTSGSCASCLTLKEVDHNVVVAGCMDGSVRLFDHRLPKNECEVRLYKDHTSRIIRVQCPHDYDYDQLITAGQQGEVNHYDLRMDRLMRRFQCTGGGELKGFDAHKMADILVSCSSTQQSISAFSRSGDSLYNIKQSQGFITSKTGLSSYLTFHPYKMKLGVTSGSNMVYVYGLPDAKRR